MVKHQGKQSFICILTSLAPLLLVMAPVPCQTQKIIQFWYMDKAEILKITDADLVFPGTGIYGTEDPSKPGDTKDVDLYGNTIRAAGVPPGTNLEYINWDPNVATTVKNNAQKCDGNPSGGNEIAVASTTSLTFTEALDRVRLECQNRNDLCSKSCQQYSILMTAGIKNFGCARVRCPDTALPYRVHCAFEPKAAFSNRNCAKPYDTDGNPCEKCPRDRGYCYNNLCVGHTDKPNILKGDPKAVIHCKTPCRNCGVRKDVSNECFCQCEAATSGTACHIGSLSSPKTCGKCAANGTPCRNKGVDAGEATCKCLCPFEFVGPTCEIPRDQGGGGTRILISGRPVPHCTGPSCSDMIPSVPEINEVALDVVKRKLVDEINKFCKKDQANYMKCCGVGTLPTSEPTDFLTLENVNIPGEMTRYREDGKMDAGLRVTAPGNNGLCRKKTAIPPPIVPVPDDIIKTVIQNNLNPCCGGIKLEHQPPSVSPGVSATMNVIMVTV